MSTQTTEFVHLYPVSPFTKLVHTAVLILSILSVVNALAGDIYCRCNKVKLNPSVLHLARPAGCNQRKKEVTLLLILVYSGTLKLPENQILLPCLLHSLL